MSKHMRKANVACLETAIRISFEVYEEEFKSVFSHDLGMSI